MRNINHRQASTTGKRVILSLVMLLGMAAITQATTINDIQVEGWYGTGVNKAVMVIDFGPNNGMADSFAFGVNFGAKSTDTITGYDMLQKASDGTPLENGSIYHTLDFDSTYYSTYKSWLVNEIWYTDPRTSHLYDVSSFTANVWWGYWNSSDARSNWTLSDVGSGDTVSNGSVHGWAVESNNDPSWPPASMPVTPMTATPEPSTLVMLLAGGLAMLAWRWRRRVK